MELSSRLVLKDKVASAASSRLRSPTSARYPNVALPQATPRWNARAVELRPSLPRPASLVHIDDGPYAISFMTNGSAADRVSASTAGLTVKYTVRASRREKEASWLRRNEKTIIATTVARHQGGSQAVA